jgi:GNAT superfamily N-acetyltransferase
MTARLAEQRDYDGFRELLPFLGPGGPVPDRARWEADFMPRTLVVDGDSGIVAYVYFDRFEENAYVWQLVVAPPSRRRGVGRALMTALAQRLRGDGIRAWALNVEPDNVPAIGLYESLGMTPCGTTVSLRFPWSLVDRLPAAPPGVVAREVDPSEDAALEARFRLWRGQLDVGRKKVGRRVIAIYEGAEPAGLAVFAPRLPSTFPLRAARAELAAALLGALRKVAELDYTLVAIDDDPGLVRSLTEHGANVFMTATRYAGSIDADP